MSYLRRLVSVRYTFLSILFLMAAVGYFMIDRLPDVYQSSARLAIQRADENIFGNESSKSETLSQRAHLVISGVFRHENAVHHLQNQGLLDIDATEEQKTEAVERFIKNASIEFDNVSVINRYTGKQGLFSLGLVVTYRDEDPELAYNFTTSIVEDVLSGVRTIADPVANQTEAFLARELDNASQQLTSMGQQIADFKNKNALYLPELHVVAVRQLDELATQILRSKQDITELRRVSAANSSDLAVTNPDALLFSPDGTRIQSAKERLEKLRIELTFAVSRYSSLHPQVVSLRREIAALEQHTGGLDTRELEVALQQAKARMATQLERYAEAHPDVVASQREVDRLTAELNAVSLSTAPRPTSEPSNPAYNRMLARRDSLNEEIARETRRLEQLEARHVEIENQLAQMPKIEQDLLALERLQSREQQGYNELERQLTAARLSSSMLSADLLERFVVIEPPVRPLKPVAPRRNLLLGLLLLLALSAASAAALLRIRMRDVIWDQDDLANLVQNRIVLVPRSN